MEISSDLIVKLQEWLAAYGLKLVAAIAIFVIGRWAAKWARRLVEKLLKRGSTDPMIVSFISSITYVALMVFIALAALGQLGIQTTSFIAIIGAAGLAIGLALQGSLANFAAGFLMILFRPFKVGDFIEGAGVTGTVEAIHIFTTTLKTPDNKVIIVPNASLSGGNITNFSAKETRRVDLTIGASYDADVRRVKQVLEDIIAGDERVLPDPAPAVVVGELADNSVNFILRVWVKSSDFWAVKCDTTEAVKIRFDEEAIGIPYPQRDVHLYEHKAG